MRKELKVTTEQVYAHIEMLRGGASSSPLSSPWPATPTKIPRSSMADMLRKLSWSQGIDR